MFEGGKVLNPRCAFAQSILTIVATFAAASVIAGCAGSTSQFNPASAGVSSQSSAPAAINPDTSCRNAGGVRVTPCRVVFTPSSPNPQTVTVTTPNGEKSKIVEHDTCGVAGIATIAQGPSGQWTVTAGSTTGNCHARFNYFNNGQRVGWAVLRVQNMI
jgi:hypothetical protein